MSTDDLRDLIDEKITTNGEQEITGAILNNVLQETVDTLADGENLDEGSIKTANIADGAITTDKIADGNVKTDKIEDHAVTKDKLGQNVSADLDWAVASNSYYRNSQAGDVAAKVITTYKNMSLIGGGSLKVTFEQANTADDATLNIDGNGAKPLYYNGQRVSSTNSWEAGETVEIYYNNYTTGIYYAKRWMVEPVSVSQNKLTIGGAPTDIIKGYFINVNDLNNHSEAYATQVDARNAVPESLRALGTTLMYQITGQGWVTEQKISGNWSSGVWRRFFDGYEFLGVASPSITFRTLSQKAFYILRPGVYSQLSNYDVKEGVITLALWDGSNWSVTQSNINYKESYQFTPGYYIDSNGVYQVAGGGDVYGATENYMPVAPDTDYIFDAASEGSILYNAWYDKDKNFISSFQSLSVHSPVNAFYVRLSKYIGTDRLTYHYYPDNLLKAVDSILTKILPLINNKADKTQTKVVGTYTGTGSHYIDSNGVYQVAGGGDIYKATENYIPVVGGMSYIFSIGAVPNPLYNAWYDFNKNFISSFQGTTATAPANACFVRLSWYNADVSSGTYTGEFPLSDIGNYITRLTKNVTDSIEYDRKNFSTNVKKVICWGDSLTQGAGSARLTNLSSVLAKLTSLGFNVSSLANGAPYPQVLQTLIGNPFTVENNGIGGEDVKAIGCRVGINDLIIGIDFTLPWNTNAVNINKSDLSYIWGGNPNFTFQANNYSPVFVNGIKCIFSYVDSNRYSVKREKNASGGTPIKVGDRISFKGVTLRNPKAAIFWVGQNGGYTDAADLIKKINAMIKCSGTENFIVVGNYPWSVAEVSTKRTLNDALVAEYGCFFEDLQQYLVKSALKDFGITPTTDADFTADQLSHGALSDEYCVTNGMLPSSFWNKCYGVDSATTNDCHLNAAGYAVVGYRIYNRMLNLGMI